ncbi:MAG: beta-ketoacyl synthase [Vicinamibacterales bacterium]
MAITGIGLVCALGASTDGVWTKLLRGDQGISPITRFDATEYSARVAGQVGHPPWDRASMSPADVCASRRGTRFFLHAAREAWDDAGLAGVGAAGAGVAVGVSANYLHMGLLQTLWQLRDARTNRTDVARACERRAVPDGMFARRQGQSAAALVAQALALTGPRLTIDTACASGSHAVIDAVRAVSRGEAPVMVAGAGSGLIVPVTLLAFGRIGALTSNADPQAASRPFDKRRDGFVLGEGAAAVVVEALTRARRRGARIYAEIRGAASTVNAFNLTDPSPAGATEAATIAEALGEASVDPADVDYIAAHGTSTPKNDQTETSAIKTALGRHASRVLVSSNKGQIGHTLPAAGAFNVATAALAIATGIAPPTATWRERDPDCDLDYVPRVGRAADLRCALAHAFAFGGQNAVIVLARATG